MKLARAALALLSLALLLPACIGELDTQSRVHDLRVLAVQATPPEILLTDLDPSQASFTVKLSVLAPEMREGLLNPRARSYMVTTCPDPEDGRCEGREGEALLASGTFEGDGFEAELAFGMEHAGLAMAALEADPWHGFGGLPLTLALKVWTQDDMVYASKQLVVQIPGLSIEGEPANENPPPPVVVDAEGKAVPASGVSISGEEVELDVDPAARDARPKYRVPTYDGGTLTLDESWSYQWFATRGSFGLESTGGMNPATGEPLSAMTRLELDGDDPGPFEAWCVLRDGRGGVSWTAFKGEFTPPAAH